MSKPAERWSEKWKARSSVARPDYIWGVEHPSRSQSESAIAQRSTFEAKMQQKTTFDKWEAGLRFTGDEGWRKGCIDKGAARYTPGIEAGEDKYRAFSTAFKGHMDSELPRIRAMSKATIDESIAKATAMIRHSAKFRFKK